MVYGKGCKGNYTKLVKASRFLPIFPDIDNERSMIYLENLCEFIKLMIDNEETGVFFPQNQEYIKTSDMVKLLAEAHGKKIRLVKVFNLVIKAAAGKVELINKVFGNLVYDHSISVYKNDYWIKNLYESIK